MNQNEISEWTHKHKNLLALCENGQTVVSKDKLYKASSEKELFEVAVGNETLIAFMCKLFSALGVGLDAGIRIHDPEIEGDAQRYILDHQAALRRQIAELSLEVIEANARSSAAKYATEFSGKLTHASAQPMAVFSGSLPTALPHITSRRLRQAGITIAADQASNDNTGYYQHILKVMQNAEVVAASGLPATVIDAIKRGCTLGIKDCKKTAPISIDARLKQILIPAGDSYLSLTPLGSGHISTIYGEASTQIESVWLQEAQEMAAAIEAASKETKDSEDDLICKKTTKRSRKKAVKDNAPEPVKVNSFKLQRIPMDFGGANPHNVTVHSRYLQKPLIFYAPQRSEGISAAHRFVRLAWKPFSGRALIKSALGHVASINAAEDGVLTHSDSVLAVEIQSKRGGLYHLVMDIHYKIIEFSDLIAESSIQIDGRECKIDYELVKGIRTVDDDSLDKYILTQEFGSGYREAVAACVIDLMLSFKEKDVLNNFLDNERTRSRVKKASLKILEDNT